jgi:hypothetical protein
MRKGFKTEGLGVEGGRCWSREAAHSAKRMGAELTEAPSFSLSRGLFATAATTGTVGGWAHSPTVLEVAGSKLNFKKVLNQ